MNLDTLGRFRAFELEQALVWFDEAGAGARVLEIGSGTGQQAAALEKRGYRVDAIDLASTPYREAQVFPVATYDGRTIPFNDSTFDIVFSSNVLEHVEDLGALLTEIRRVLRPGGLSIHLMPTPAWRAWSLATHFGWGAKRLLAIARGGTSDRGELGRPRRAAPSLRSALASLLPRRHGEHGTALGELLAFRRDRWIRVLGQSGLDYVGDAATGLFYTNALLLGDLLPISLRRSMSVFTGSACHTYCFRRPIANKSE